MAETKSSSRKRKAESTVPGEYAPSLGYVNFTQFKKAVDEFGRVDSEDKKVLLAKCVNVQKWLHSGINERMGNVFVVADFKNGDNLTDSTVADLWIVKVQNKPHELVATEVAAMLVFFRNMHGNLRLAVGGGNMSLPGTVRRPDTAVSPRSIPEILNGQSALPRVLVEIEFEHRSIRKAHKFCLEYFALIPVLQAVVLLVFYGKRANGSFAALAVLFRRAGAGGAVVDAVSFGTAHIFARALPHIPAAIRALPIRVLPLAPVGIALATPNPWTPADHAFIRIPGADMFHLGPGGALIVGAPAPMPDCLIDLWTIILAIENEAF